MEIEPTSKGSLAPELRMAVTCTRWHSEEDEWGKGELATSNKQHRREHLGRPESRKLWGSLRRKLKRHPRPQLFWGSLERLPSGSTRKKKKKNHTLSPSVADIIDQTQFGPRAACSRFPSQT